MKMRPGRWFRGGASCYSGLLFAFLPRFLYAVRCFPRRFLEHLPQPRLEARVGWPLLVLHSTNAQGRLPLAVPRDSLSVDLLKTGFHRHRPGVLLRIVSELHTQSEAPLHASHG